MKLANIVPPQWQWLYPQGEYRMALAHWALSHPDYVKHMGSKDAYVMVDHGLFEGEKVPLQDLASVYLALDADEVVLPDVYGSPKETLSASWMALGKVKARRVMFVPHGITHEERWYCLEAWIDQWEKSDWKNYLSLAIGVTCLRQRSDVRVPRIGTRTQFIQRLAREGLQYPVHLLGIPDLAVFATSELPVAHALGVRGVDSSVAFALGAAGQLLTPKSRKVRLGPPGAYEFLGTYNRRLALLNQRILGEWISQGQHTEAIPTHWIRQTASKWLKYYAEGFAELTTVMKACGMPKGCYALLRVGRREVEIRALSGRGSISPQETLVEVDNDS